MTNPAEIRKIADRRLEEAKHLLAGGFTEGAYYLAGYSIELHLKAKICEHLGLDDLFVEATSVVRASQSHSQIGKLFKFHELGKLLLLSGLSQQLENEKVLDPILFRNWELVTEWSETRRYALIGSISPDEASELIEAIVNPQTGLLAWIRKH